MCCVCIIPAYFSYFIFLSINFHNTAFFWISISACSSVTNITSTNLGKLSNFHI